MEINSYDPAKPPKKVFSVTLDAQQKIKGLLDLEQEDTLKFRVYVTGGGCSGFTYGFMFDREQNEDDIEVELAHCPVLIDSMSFPYLQGAKLDYASDLDGAKFRVHNPNATSTCSCGSSFVI